MQKLPEVSDMKKGRRMRKEKGDLPTEGAGPFFFRQWPANWQHPCLAGDRHHANVFGRGVGYSFHPVATLSVNSMPKYKKATKWNNELKQLDFDKLPKATNHCWDFKIL